MPQRGSGLAVSTEQLHAVRDMLSDELLDADSVRVDLSEPNLFKFVVSVGEQQRYRLAVIADASRALSNTRPRVFRAASTNTNWAPLVVLLRYQKRVLSSIHCGLTWSPEIMVDVCHVRKRSARL